MNSRQRRAKKRLDNRLRTSKIKEAMDYSWRIERPEFLAGQKLEISFDNKSGE